MKTRPKEMGNMESLLIKNEIDSSRWYPILVSNYRQDVSYGILDSLGIQYRKNISYSLQYLEYIELQLKELNVSSVIRSMLFKNFIIVAASIIEVVFYHLAKANGKIKLRYEKQVYRQDIKKPKDINPNVSVDKFTLLGYETLDRGVEDMTKFEQLISIVRDNKLLIDTDLSKTKNYLKLLRKLRNKIHLTTATELSETDYNRFCYSDYLSAKYFLFTVLNDGIFGKEKQTIIPRIIEATNQQIYNYKNNNLQSYIWINLR